MTDIQALDAISRANLNDIILEYNGVNIKDEPVSLHLIRRLYNPDTKKYDGTLQDITDLDYLIILRDNDSSMKQYSEAYKLMNQSMSGAINKSVIEDDFKIYYSTISTQSSDLIKLLVPNSVIGLRIDFNSHGYIKIGKLDDTDPDTEHYSPFTNRLITIEIGEISTDNEVNFHKLDTDAHSESIGVREYTNKQNPDMDLVSDQYIRFINKYANGEESDKTFTDNIDFRLGSIIHSANYSKTWVGYHLVT